MYTCPLLNDWFESLVIFSILLEESRVRINTTGILEMIKVMLSDITLMMGAMMNTGRPLDLSWSVYAINSRCVDQGGLLLPNSWFSLDVAPMEFLLAKWAREFSVTLGTEAGAVTIDPRPFASRPCYNLSDALSQTGEIPLMTFHTAKETLIGEVVEMIKTARKIRSSAGLVFVQPVMREQVEMWRRVPVEWRDRVGDMMDRILGNMLEHPMPHFGWHVFGTA
jgi:hypothetical protein